MTAELASPAVGARTGSSPLERAAVEQVRADIASFPASLVVSLLLWPETIAGWSRGEGVTPPLVHNALAGRKPFVRLRQRLAERLDVPAAVLADLIDTQPRVPRALRPPVPPGAPTSAWTWSPATGERLGRRDGTNPLEQKAVYRVALDVAALSASLVVQLLLHPTTLASWCRAEGLSSAITYALLAGTQRAPRVEATLARRIGVAEASLRELIDASCGPPGDRAIGPPPASAHAPSPGLVLEPGSARPRSRVRPAASPLQLRLDIGSS
ncbi:MAG: hypothetical protein ACR2HK_13500 [Gemmatimonadales bacterium]